MIFLSEKVFFESKISIDDITKISQLVRISQSMLQDDNGDASNLFQSLEQMIFSQLPESEGRSLLTMKIPPQSPYFLVPTLVAQRQKNILHKTINDRSYEFVLKESYLQDSAGQTYQSFELEAEADDDPSQLASETCHLLQENLLSKVDIVDEQIDFEGESLKFYQTHKMALGF